MLLFWPLSIFLLAILVSWLLAVCHMFLNKLIWQESYLLGILQICLYQNYVHLTSCEDYLFGHNRENYQSNEECKNNTYYPFNLPSTHFIRSGWFFRCYSCERVFRRWAQSNRSRRVEWQGDLDSLRFVVFDSSDFLTQGLRLAGLQSWASESESKGWETWTRTKINRFRVCCPTIRRSPIDARSDAWGASTAECILSHFSCF